MGKDLYILDGTEYPENYRYRYERDTKPRIGKMKITDDKAMHFQQIINSMDGRYATSTIYQTYICMDQC